MNWFERLRTFAQKEESGRALDGELEFHLEHQVAENIAAGMSPEDARYAALRDFGTVAVWKEQCRSARGLDWLEHFFQDLRYAWRNYLHRPGYALAIVALTAVGIAATTAVFSFADRVLFRPLPYASAGRLVSFGLRIPWLDYDFLTAHSYAQLRHDPGPFSAVTSWDGIDDCDATAGQAVRLACARVESTFLPVLGVEPVIGRNFTREEDQPNVPVVALISHGLWVSRFASDPNIAGRRMTLNGEPATIRGVLPPDFETPTLQRADVFIPQALPPDPPPGPRALRVYGRLRVGVSSGQARDAILARAQQLFTELPPHIRKQVQFHVQPLRDVQTGDFRLASWTLFGAVLAVLLIACANAANLMMARSVARAHELAIRVALGAGRSRMIRQTLTETLALSITGGILGCVLAVGLLRLFIRIAPTGIPHLAAASLDGRVLLAGLTASLLCGIVFGLAPAFYTPQVGMLTGTRTTAPAGVVSRCLLVGAQIAASLVLLTCATMLIESLWNRLAVSLGMSTDHVVTAQVRLGSRYAEPAARAAFYDQLQERLWRLPGVEQVALSDSLPPGGVPHSQPILALRVQGQPALDDGTPGVVVWRAVTPEYFRALRIPILRGSAFTNRDREPSERSMILSAAFARRMFGDQDPVGRRVSRFPADAVHTLWYTVVGIAGDARNSGLTDGNDPEYYIVRRRGGPDYIDSPEASAIIVRAKASSAAVESWLKTVIAGLDPALPAVIGTLDQHVLTLAARPRFQAWLLAMFAGIGLMIAAFGLYSLVAYLVAQREREFGVRLALGATPAQVVRLILGDAAGCTLGGLVIGLAGAIAASYSLRSLLFHVSASNPTLYFVPAILMVVLAIAAALLPAYRITKLDPAVILRQD